MTGARVHAALELTASEAREDTILESGVQAGEASERRCEASDGGDG